MKALLAGSMIGVIVVCCVASVFVVPLDDIPEWHYIAIALAASVVLGVILGSHDEATR